MMHSEVISAFIDNEPFDSRELAEALADPDGRAMLIDLIALRSLAEPDEAPVAVAPPRRRTRPLQMAIAAAAVVTALAGGYQWGERAAVAVPDPESPPAPSRVVSAGAEWVVPPGGSR